MSSILSSPSLLLRSEDALFETIRGLALNSDREPYFRLLEFVHFELLSPSGIASASEWISECFDQLTKPIWEGLRSRLLQPIDGAVASFGSRSRFAVVSPGGDPALDSKIIATFPKLFSMFRAHLFKLLYRGSRDGFRASDFHSRCDGHSPTVTVILSENGSIFGGYTPQAWHALDKFIADLSRKSFIFTLKNPHNLEPRIFPLLKEHLDHALYGKADRGPCFGYGHNIGVVNNCNASPSNYTGYFGTTYSNDTELDRETLLTGGEWFQVQEIEVFELST
jgi:hypothetical protein